jgi:hypothetical protein
MELLKYCYKCKTKKLFEFFGKNRRNPDGYADECRQCKREKDREYAARHREEAKKRASDWYYAHKDNPEFKVKAQKNLAKWRKANLDKHAAKETKRRASKLKATPSWLSEDHLKQIEIEYALSKWCTEVMNTTYHVDHIVPLKGKTVCGLHVPWNLRVIPASANLSKGNRYVG